jgi:transaldolase
MDHASHITYLTLKGYTKLAADHILHPEMKGHLEETVGNAVRQLTLAFNQALLERNSEKNIILCARIYDVLTNMTLNLVGLERAIIGFSDVEVEKTLTILTTALMDLETLERNGVFGGERNEASIAKAVVDNILTEMKTVMKGVYRPPGAMVAHVAEEIEKNIDNEKIIESFLGLAKQQIQENMYYKFSAAGMCKFGNDYALGLRWLRHLGFVQVSTNPSLAAIAYDDDPSQWEGYRGEDLCPDFKTTAKQHAELFKDPEKIGDEITAYATEVSIWRNLTVFRPIAVASNMFHGMISLQLNPNIADIYEDSVAYALKFYKDAKEFLRQYDAYLLWGYSTNVERSRPNIVFKVAGSSPASIDITRKLESLGIGTNNTVTFTVSQEVELILAKMEGRAEAVKKGVPLTTVYETNMGGRLDDYIREVQAEMLVKKALEKVPDKEKDLKVLAEELGAWNEAAQKKTFTEKVTVVSSRKYLRPLTKEPLIRFLADHGLPFNSKERVKAYLETLESDIGYCGILVTKRVYEIFFSPQNKTKWTAYLQRKYGLTKKQAEEIMRGIDVLPASKRHPKETLLTLAEANMTHTEFPNHQTTVVTAGLEQGFTIENCKESVLKGVNPEILKRITADSSDIRNVVAEFYEVTAHQSEILKEAKITDPEKYGSKGLLPSQWGNFGSTIKTMDEFSNSYETFKAKCIQFIRKISREK